MSRQVTRTSKDLDGDITALCGDWGKTFKYTAIAEINQNPGCYYVQQPGTLPVDVIVVLGPTGPYLRTTADQYDANNLDNLPPC